MVSTSIKVCAYRATLAVYPSRPNRAAVSDRGSDARRTSILIAL